MSTESAEPKTPKLHTSKKHKDKSEKKSSKKRQREEQSQVESAIDQPSPSKKQRKTKPSPVPTPVQAEDETERALVETHSPFIEQTTTFYLPLSPVAHRFPLQGLCAEHLSPLLLTYYPPLRGIVLSYSNPRLSANAESIPSNLPKHNGRPAPETRHTKPDRNSDSDSASDADLDAEARDDDDDDDDYDTSKPTEANITSQSVVLAKAIDEYAASWVHLTADFLVLRPVKGKWIEGHVRVQNESYLGVVCWNFFNAGIEKRRLPDSWTWVEGTGEVATRRGRASRSDAAEEEAVFEDDEGDGEEPDGEAREEGTDTAERDQEHYGAEEGMGYFVDGQGKKVEGMIRFRVRDFESAPSTERERGFVSIEGTLLNAEDDKKVDDEIREKNKGKGKGKGRRLGRMPVNAT